MKTGSTNSYLKQNSANNQQQQLQKNNQQKNGNQEKQSDSIIYVQSTVIPQKGQMEEVKQTQNVQSKEQFSNTDKKYQESQNENVLVSQLEQKIQELQNQLNVEKEQNSQNQKNASDQYTLLTNQLVNEYDKTQRDLTSKLKSATNEIEKLNRKLEQLQEQLTSKILEQKQCKEENNNLNYKYKQIEKELNSYKYKDEQNQKQIKSYTTRYTQSFQELQKTKSSLQSEQYHREQLEIRLQETKDSLHKSVIDFNNLKSQTQKKSDSLEKQIYEQQQSYGKQIKELEQQINQQQRVNKNLESSKLQLEVLRKKQKIDFENYNKLYDQYQSLQKTNLKQALEISGFEPAQLELVYKISEVEFQATDLQAKLNDALKQIEQRNQLIEEQQQQNCEQIQNQSKDELNEKIYQKEEQLKTAQLQIEELLKYQHELEDENYQVKQQKLDQEKELLEKFQIANKQFQEIQTKFDVLKNQEVEQNKIIEELKYQLKQKDRDIQQKMKQITQNVNQQLQVGRKYQTQTINQNKIIGSSENQFLNTQLQDSEKKVTYQKENLTNSFEAMIKKHNELVDAIKSKCSQLENQLEQVQNQLFECEKELNRKEQKIRDQELEIAMLSGSHSKPYIDESKHFYSKQTEQSQKVSNDFQSSQMTRSQIQQRPSNNVQLQSKNSQIISQFQKDLNNNKYSISLLLGKNENGKQQVMNTLFDNQQKELYQAYLEVQCQTLVINTDSFDFDDIDEREKQIIEYKKLFNQFANKQFNFWIVIPFVRTDFMKKDLMDIYKYFHKLNVSISIVVTDFQLSENQEDETNLRSKFTLFKPRQILFIGRDTSKNQLIQMLKSTLPEEDSNSQTQLTIKNTIFEDEDIEEQQMIIQQFKRQSHY